MAAPTNFVYLKTNDDECTGHALCPCFSLARAKFVSSFRRIFAFVRSHLTGPYIAIVCDGENSMVSSIVAFVVPGSVRTWHTPSTFSYKKRSDDAQCTSSHIHTHTRHSHTVVSLSPCAFSFSFSGPRFFFCFFLCYFYVAFNVCISFYESTSDLRVYE